MLELHHFNFPTLCLFCYVTFGYTDLDMHNGVTLTSACCKRGIYTECFLIIKYCLI